MILLGVSIILCFFKLVKIKLRRKFNRDMQNYFDFLLNNKVIRRCASHDEILFSLYLQAVSSDLFT